MDVVAELERARECHRRQAWADACDGFLAVDGSAGLEIEDLERLAEAAHVLGRCDLAVAVSRRVYQVHVDAGDIGRAVRCAFHLWHALVVKGDFAHAGGWLVRAGRLTETHPDCGELGYLLIPEAERQFGEGDFAGAFVTAGQAVEMGQRCADRDLVTVAAHIQGRARIRAGRVGDGLALLDEAMVAVAAGETSAGISCWIYCSVIDACHVLHEVHRAREWTVALNAWCDAQPQFTGVFSGVCRIHRAELLQLGGAWADAVREAGFACDQLTQGYGEASGRSACLVGVRTRGGSPRGGQPGGGPAGPASCVAAVAGPGRTVRGRVCAGAGRAGLPRPARRGHRGDRARRGPSGLRPAGRGPGRGPHHGVAASRPGR